MRGGSKFRGINRDEKRRSERKCQNVKVGIALIQLNSISVLCFPQLIAILFVAWLN